MSSIFKKTTGDYAKPGDSLGKAQDSVLLSVMPPDGARRTATPGEALHPHLSLTTDYVVADLERIMRCRGEKLQTELARRAMRDIGEDPDNAPVFNRRQAARLHNKIVNMLRDSIRDRNVMNNYGNTYEAMLTGKDTDTCLWTFANGAEGQIRTTMGAVRAALRMSVEEFLALQPRDKRLATQRISRRLLREGARVVDPKRDKEMGLARDALHHSLREWANGPLVLERPSGSSLHHLIDYDMEHTEGRFGEDIGGNDTQIIVVENDWGAAVPQIEGEWRVPFELICWEFRISGVRVLAFTDMSSVSHKLWCVYGRDGHWVVDDFAYDLDHSVSGLPRGQTLGNGDVVEFRHVATKVYDCIRASCIMLDAQVARHDHVTPPTRLLEKRSREGRAPLRDHYVVRLLHSERRVHRTASARLGEGPRTPQRGHWRKGTWVHYDDPDSGQVQYPNDGGFVVSKTWRRWHFAGDPRNIIHKEYRL
jgi:hypothetical protein